MKKLLLLLSFTVCKISSSAIVKMKAVFIGVLFLLCTFSHAQVSQEWLALFNYEGNTTDEPSDMVIDAEGNIYITGFTTYHVYDFITLKYNKQGRLLWSEYYDGPLGFSDVARAIAVDQDGNVYVTGDSQNDLLIIKYSPLGEERWTQYYSTVNSDGGYDIEIGENGMIYVVGYSSSNMITLQYNSDGEMQWESMYNGSDGGLDIGFALVLDELSNVYITGYSTNIGTGRDFTTIKYNAYGEEQWVAVYNGPGNLPDEAQSIETDELNNIYVLGYSNDENGKQQFATIKYDNYGNQQWVNRFFNPETMIGSPKSLAVFNSENIYVCGSIGKGYATVKINAEGDTVWTRNYGLNHNDQFATDNITDDAGNVYVTGWIRVTSGVLVRDYGTIKYNPNGDLKWEIRYESPEGGRDDALKVCLDAENNVIVTGATTANNSYDIGTIKYHQSETGIDNNISPIEFELFPNPAGDQFMFQSLPIGHTGLKFTTVRGMIELYDLNGRKLLNKQIPSGSEEVTIDVSGLQRGFYLCKISTQDYSITKKLIIQK